MGNDISKMTSMDFDLYFNQHKILEISPKFYERLKKYVMEFGYPEKSIKIKKGQKRHDPNSKYTYFNLTWEWKSKSPEKPKNTSFSVYEFDDEWFLVRFHKYFAAEMEHEEYYICDQFDSVLKLLDQCFKYFPKKDDPKWNSNIEKEFLKKRDRLLNSELDKVRKRIMSFKDFDDLENWKMTISVGNWK